MLLLLGVVAAVTAPAAAALAGGRAARRSRSRREAAAAASIAGRDSWMLWLCVEPDLRRDRCCQRTGWLAGWIDLAGVIARIEG